jgi:hypothetical protein
MKKDPKISSPRAKTDPKIANAFLSLAVAAGNKAKVREPKLELPRQQKSPFK